MENLTPHHIKAIIEKVIKNPDFKVVSHCVGTNIEFVKIHNSYNDTSMTFNLTGNLGTDNNWISLRNDKVIPQTIKLLETEFLSFKLMFKEFEHKAKRDAQEYLNKFMTTTASSNLYDDLV